MLEQQDKIVDLFYKFDPEKEGGGRSGKLSKDNLMTCLLTLSELLSITERRRTDEKFVLENFYCNVR